MAVSVDQFGKALVASGLLTADDVKALWAEFPHDARPKDGEAFSKRLVEQGKLTDFQAKQVLAGRGTALVMGEYVILEEIGAGGMGQVYKAQHRRMKRIVALKVMSSAAMKDEASVKRFQREVEAAARLEHPNIVTAYDAGRAGNVAFLVMQFVDGGDLSSLIKGHGPLAIEQACDYIRQAATGLAYAHGEGVIHRDIKPANLLCDKKGVVKILDMGLARIEKGDDGLTGTEQVMGTVDYMSPEQASSTKGADARSDIYSLGCTLWYLLTARKAYDGESLIERLMAHREQPLPSLVKTRDDAPWSLEQVLHKMLAKRAADRFQTMDEVVAALDPFAPARSGSGSGSGSGIGSSIGQGSGPHDAELSAFFRSVGPGAKPSQASKTAVPTDATAQFARPEVGTDPQSEILPPRKPAAGLAPRAAARPPARQAAPAKDEPLNWKLVAAGVGAAAVLLIAAIAYLARSGDEGASVSEPGAPATGVLPSNHSQTPVAHTPGSTGLAAGGSTPLATGGSQQPPGAAPAALPPPPGDYALTLTSAQTPLDLDLSASGPLTFEGYFTPRGAADEQQALFVCRNAIVLRGGSQWAMTVWTNQGIKTVPSGVAPETGKRTHVAGVYSTKGVQLFIDGVLKAKLDFAGMVPVSGQKRLEVGGSLSYVVDELRVSNSARYTVDFTPAARFEPDARALALYHCDEGVGDVLRDASANNRDAVVTGAKWLRADGSPIPPPTVAKPISFLTPTTTPAALPPPGDYALDFSSEGAAVNVPTLQFDPTGPLTIECWCRPTGTVEVASRIIGHSKKLWITQKRGEIAPLTLHGMTSAGQFSVADPAGPMPVGQRIHLAGVRAGSELRFFVNGKRVGQTGALEGPFTDTVRAVFEIGHNFPGLIDEARVSKVARYDMAFTPPDRFDSDADTTALYHFEEGGGVTLSDSSGNNHHGTIIAAKWVKADGSPIPPPVAAAAPVAPPPGDYALLFDGNSVVEFDDPLPHDVNSCTVEGYVRVDAHVPRAMIYSVSERGYLGLDPVTGQECLMTHSFQPNEKLDRGGHQNAGTRGPIALNQRVHVAGVYDKTEFRFYLDGKKQPPPSPKKDRTFNLGRRPPNIGSQFKGVIDEVRVSKSVRYAADFTPAARHEPDADTLALYHCDEGVGGVLKDSSGNNRHGRIVSAKWVRPDGSPIPPPIAAAAPAGLVPRDYALQFDGQRSHVVVPSWRYRGEHPLTVEARFKPMRAEEWNSIEVLMGDIQNAGWNFGYHSGVPPDPSGLKWSFYLNLGTYQGVRGSLPIRRDRWSHLAGVFDGGSEIQFYIDGRLQGRTKTNGSYRPSTVPFTIGANSEPNDVFSEFFQGAIDEVRISKRVRYAGDFPPPSRFEPDADTVVLYHFDEGAGDVLTDSSGNNHHGIITAAKWVRADGSATPAASSPGVIYLDDLPEKSWRGYGLLGKHGRYLNNATVNRGGKRVEHSLFTSPEVDEGFVEYDLPAGYATFRAVAYLLRTPGGPQTFQVVGDGKVLWKSEPQTAPNVELDVNADVRNVKALRLEVSGIGSNSHPVWVDPRLIPTVAAASGAMPVPVAAAGAVDLLPLVRIQSPTGSDPWVRDANGIVISEAQFSRTLIDADLPPEYELHVDVVPLTGNHSLVMGLSRAGNRFWIPVSGWNKASTKIEPTPTTGSGISSSNELRLVADQPVHCVFTVRKDRITLVADGKTLIDWQGDSTTIPEWSGWKVSEPQKLAIGAWMGRMRITRLELRPLASLAGVAPAPIDLLAAFDPARDVIAGTWSKQNGALVTPQDGTGINNARIKLPTPGPVPAEYDVELVVERTSNGGHGMVFGFVMGGRQAVLHMDSYPTPLWGISDIDGKGGKDNAARNQGGRLLLGKRKTVNIEVRKDRVRAACDGEPIVDWQGRPEQLSNGFWAVPDAKSLFLGSQSPFLVHAIRLTPKSP